MRVYPWLAAFVTIGMLALAQPACAAGSISLLDLVEMDYSYTTIVDHFDEPVVIQRLLDGARGGLEDYLRARGIAEPHVARMHARPDGRGAVPSVEQQIALAIERYGMRVTASGLVYAAIRGELAALQDPYSVFFTAAEMKGFNVALNGSSTAPPEVTQALLPGDVGYVALHGFSLDAAPHVRAAFDELRSRGARAFVFDLRGNGGGYEISAVRVASLFVASGPIVTNVERGGKRAVSMADGNALPPVPLAVLVDRDSASGAEVVAAAIQDRGAGRLVGARTFGKGVAQSVFPMPDGSAIKLTTARYYTAAGRSIEGTGVTPDLAVDEPAGATRGMPGQDAQLDAALGLLTSYGV